MEQHNSVDSYIENAGKYREILIFLRRLLHQTELQEAVKWGAPAYLLDGKIVVGLMAFKSYCGLWFHQGVFLKDELKVLTNADDGTKAMRSWRFDFEDEIPVDAVAAYVNEAIENQKKGLKVKPQKKPLVIPPELQKELDADPELATAFERLNLTRKKDFAHYITTAKREQTKLDRIDKIIPMIFDGVGVYDKYKG